MALRDLTAKILLQADTTGLLRGFREAKTSLERFERTATRLGRLAAGGAGVALATEAFQRLQDAANLEAQEEALRRQLTGIGQDFDEFIGKLDDVAQGTVAARNLIQSSSRALLLGIPADQIAELLDVARASAIATGQSVAQAFDDIATGIGRASPLILDNLGLTVKLGPAYEAYAESIGKAAKELTAQEQKQALVNEVLRVGGERVTAYGDAADGAATRFQRLRAALDDAVDAVLRFGATSTETSPRVNRFFDSMENFLQLFLGEESLTKQYEDFDASLRASVKTMADANKELNPMVESFDELADDVGSLLEAWNTFSGATNDLVNEFDDLTEKTGDLGTAWNILTQTGTNVSDNFLNLVRNGFSVSEAQELLSRTGRQAVDVQEDLAETAGEAAEAQQTLSVTTQSAADQTRRHREETVRLREELARTQQQVVLTARAFDQLRRTQGEAAAVQAALAGGGELVLGGTRINVRGGSRLVREASTSSSQNVTPGVFSVGGVGGTTQAEQSTFFPGLTTQVRIGGR